MLLLAENGAAAVTIADFRILEASRWADSIIA